MAGFCIRMRELVSLFVNGYGGQILRSPLEMHFRLVADCSIWQAVTFSYTWLDI